MACYQNHVFFEVVDLDENQKEKIKKYFEITRKSGGGECGPVEKVGDKTYRIAFKEQTAQERVLNKKDHLIILRQGDISLTLWGSDPLQAEDIASQQSCKEGQNAASGGQQKERILPLNPYLLRYLRESPRAELDLQRQLSSLSCSLEFQLDCDVVLVKGVVQKGQTDSWDAQVDRVFDCVRDRYQCHYEVEPVRLQALLQYPHQTTEEVRIYNEPLEGFAVLVGEAEKVNKCLGVMETLCLKREITTQCKVLDMQYCLVEEQFQSQLRSQHPGVKVTRQGSETLIIEGPEDEVREAQEKLEEMVKGIRKKRMQFHPELLNFLKSNRGAQKYQTRFTQSLRSPVALEVGVDLNLYSTSPEVLEEVAIIVQNDLREESIWLEGNELASPGFDQLKKTLQGAQSLANQDGTRVQVAYEGAAKGIPRTRVQLLGYCQEVERLKGLLLDYKHNQAETQSSVPLPLPEMVDCFIDIINLVGMKLSGVKLSSSFSPSPGVNLIGPHTRVQELRDDLSILVGMLRWEFVVLDGPGALQYCQGEGAGNIMKIGSFHNVFIHPLKPSPISSHGTSPPGSRASFSVAASPAQQQPVLGGNFGLEVVLGSLEEQQVDALVAPILNSDLLSTLVGKCLAQKSKNKLQQKLNLSTRGHNLSPGDVLEVDGTPPLACRRIFFIQCLPWDGAGGYAGQALRSGLGKVLKRCEQQSLSSVAFPVIGPGIALKYPSNEAAQILTQELARFGREGSMGGISIVRIVIKPGSDELYQDVYQGLNLQLLDQSWGHSVFRWLASDLDDITVQTGGVQLQVVFGDITDETTDVIVNTTDFADYETSVCRDILTVAGPEIRRELLSARVARGQIFVSQPGSFCCKAIMHMCGAKDVAVIQGLVRDTVLKSEELSHSSVAIPAICAGKGGLPPKEVADAILQGIQDALSTGRLQHLSNIRIVLLKIHVFLEFKACLQNHFGQTVTQKVCRKRTESKPPSIKSDSSIQLFLATPVNPPAKFLVVGVTQEDVTGAGTDLQKAYQAQCCQRELNPQDMAQMTQKELDALAGQMESLGVRLEMDGAQSGGCVLSGLQNGVNEVCLQVQRTAHAALLREMQGKKQDDMYARVIWCLLRPTGIWERFPKEANLQLERRELEGGVKDTEGVTWDIDLQKMEARLAGASQVIKIKRLENLPGFIFPLYWDNMSTGTAFQTYILQPSSLEYRLVKRDFKKTVSKTVIKIERIQNVHLRRGYEALKLQLEEKIGTPGGAEEKTLYHGTQSQACTSIQKNGFNRRFAGQNATRYGLGVYFAVKASYSANPIFSRPDQDGSQFMFVARVLTGHYTLGQEDMKVPPSRSAQDTNDRFDSLVDDEINPQMFVVFHDNQAYPDYLVTFK